MIMIEIQSREPKKDHIKIKLRRLQGNDKFFVICNLHIPQQLSLAIPYIIKMNTTCGSNQVAKLMN